MMTARQLTPICEFDNIPGQLPTAIVPEDADLPSIAKAAVIQLNDLQEHDLVSYAIWRDLLAFTGTFRTIYSSQKVFKIWQILSKERRCSMFQLKEDRAPRIAHGNAESHWIDIDVLFTAQLDSLGERCMGTISLVHDSNNKWRIWMLRTWLECFDGYGHPDVLEPIDAREMRTIPHEGGEKDDYDAVVVGGGQAGLSIAGRLQALGVSYITLERNAEVGDSWGNRYESLKWHTVKEYGNLPFGHSFPDDEYMVPTKQIGAGHKRWAKAFGINVKTSTSVESATWDDSVQKWTVTASAPEGTISLTARNLVLSMGCGLASPRRPSWASAADIERSGFKGTILHSSDGYRSAHEWSGRRGVVIGTANTAHDVAEDMANAGMETTMVQRGATFVFPGEFLWAAQSASYKADVDPAVVDRMEATMPNIITRAIVTPAVWGGIKAMPERFDALEKAGFKLDRYGDLFSYLFIRFGAHYIDIGCSKRIAKGEIKMKTAPVKGLTKDGLAFEDGTELGADLIVLCTGFNEDFRMEAARIVGQDIADQVDQFWGPDKEGELRAHARTAGHPNLYYHGGDTRQARFFSQFLALSIQADVLGHPFEPYLG